MPKRALVGWSFPSIAAVFAAVFAACVTPEWRNYTPDQLDRIVVTRGDFSKPYEILGSVRWPERGHRVIGADPVCRPDRLRGLALSRWAEQVDGLIGFTTWQDGSQHTCEATAVRFEERDERPIDSR